MKTLKFETNINCGSCIKAVTPILNQMDEIEEWTVNTEIPEKILTISGEDELSEKEIIENLKKVGYQAQII